MPAGSVGVTGAWRAWAFCRPQQPQTAAARPPKQAFARLGAVSVAGASGRAAAALPPPAIGGQASSKFKSAQSRSAASGLSEGRRPRLSLCSLQQ